MARPATVAESILDGEGYLYKRPDSVLYQCRFKVGKKWIVKSTGEKDRKQALEKAREYYYETKYKAKEGLPLTTGKTFGSISKIICDELKPLATPNSAAFNHWSRLTNYINPYFATKRITSFTTQDLRDFHTHLMQKAGKELNANTIKSYNSSINLVFKRAVDMKVMRKAEIPDFPTSGAKRNQRPAFTEDEFKALCKHMLQWSAEDEQLNAFHNNRKRLLVVVVYFVAKTGVRPGTELESIKWSGIEKFKDKAGNAYAEIRVDGKVGPRQLVADGTVLQLLENYKAQATRDVKNDDAVFVLDDGAEFCKSGELFKELLESAGLLLDPYTKDERTLYSLRHYYITEALYRDVSPAFVAKQCGTSISQIDKNYSKVNPRLAAKQIVPKP